MRVICAWCQKPMNNELRDGSLMKAISANTSALLAFNKDYSEVAGKLGGEVIECIYSHLPEGCGKTIHCTGCQIRGSVNHTRTTGEPLRRTKAYQYIMTRTGVKTFDYHISTESLEDRTAEGRTGAQLER